MWEKNDNFAVAFAAVPPQQKQSTDKQKSDTN